MKVSELTGAQLDYWVARAEGIPAERLEIRRVPRTDWLHVVRTVDVKQLGVIPSFRVASEVLRYSTDWAQGGPLIEKHLMYVDGGDMRGWSAGTGPDNMTVRADGGTPLQAICRAVVRAAFGDEVEEVPIAQA